MSKNKVTVIICVISMIIGFALGIILPSLNNITAINKDYKLTEFSGDDAVFSQTENGYYACFTLSGEYVGYIKLSGSVSAITDAKLSVAESDSTDYSAEKFNTVKLTSLGDDAYIKVDSNAYVVKIILSANEAPVITSVTVNPQNIVLDFSSIFIWTFGLLLIVGLLVFIFLYKDSFSAYSQIFGKYRHLVGNLISRDLKVKYRRSMLGFLWSILNPLLMALVINAVFQNLFRFDIEYFIVYYLTGSLIFNFMTEATTGSLTSVINAASLIKKVYIPKYIFPLEKCLFAFVNMLFSSVAIIIVILIKQMPVSFSILLFFIPMIYVLIFSLGLSLILSSINVFFRDIGHLYTVWTVAWMYLTPIIYPASILPDTLRKIMQLNPMYYYVTYFRDVVMYGTIPDLRTNLICIIYALLFFSLGLLTFKKQQDKFILYI